MAHTPATSKSTLAPRPPQREPPHLRICPFRIRLSDRHRAASEETSICRKTDDFYLAPANRPFD